MKIILSLCLSFRYKKFCFPLWSGNSLNSFVHTFIHLFGVLWTHIRPFLPISWDIWKKYENVVLHFIQYNIEKLIIGYILFNWTVQLTNRYIFSFVLILHVYTIRIYTLLYHHTIEGKNIKLLVRCKIYINDF